MVDNVFTNEKALILIGLLTSHKLNGFTFVNRALNYDFLEEEYSSFCINMKPIKHMPNLISDIRWGKEICLWFLCLLYSTRYIQDFVWPFLSFIRVYTKYVILTYSNILIPHIYGKDIDLCRLLRQSILVILFYFIESKELWFVNGL